MLSMESFSSDLECQSGLLHLYHFASHLAGEYLRPSCVAIVSIFCDTVVICLYNMSSPTGPLGLPDHQHRRLFVLCYPGPIVVAEWCSAQADSFWCAICTMVDFGFISL